MRHGLALGPKLEGQLVQSQELRMIRVKMNISEIGIHGLLSHLADIDGVFDVSMEGRRGYGRHH